MTIEARSPVPHVPVPEADDDDGPDSGDPDADALALVEQRDLDAALRLLMRRHGKSIYRLCREALRDAARADDVHQRVFIEAHRDLPKFAGRSRVKTWLFAIAKHRIADDIKMHTRAQRRLEHEEAEDPVDPGPLPDERLDDARLREALAACMEELPPDTRTAVLLRYQQDMSFEDMAVICNEKPGTLQARVARAVEKLKASIRRRTGGTP